MRRHRSLSVFAAAVSVPCALSAVALPATAAELLTNGNLDQTYQQEITPGFFLPKPANWVNVGTRTLTGPYEDEMSSETFAGGAPTPVTSATDNGVFFKPFTGGGANGPATGHLYQDNPATPGKTYTLTGWAGAEANFLGGAEMAVEFLDTAGNLIAGSGSVLNLRTAGLFTANGQPFNYKQFSVSALAPADATSVRSRVSMVNATNNPEGGGQAFVVDDFSLVPEPTGLAMALPAALALLRRRRA